MTARASAPMSNVTNSKFIGQEKCSKNVNGTSNLESQYSQINDPVAMEE
jgi:hypothetical protein